MARVRSVVGTAVVLGLLVLAGTVRADEAAAVKAIEKMGGKVTRDDKRPGKPVLGVDLSQKQITDAGLKLLKEFKTLQMLNIRSTAVTDAGLKELKELKNLETLDLT